MKKILLFLLCISSYGYCEYDLEEYVSCGKEYKPDDCNIDSNVYRLVWQDISMENYGSAMTILRTKEVYSTDELLYNKLIIMYIEMRVGKRAFVKSAYNEVEKIMLERLDQ